MKKLILSILLFVAVVTLSLIAYASVGVKVNGTNVGAATDINISTPGPTSASFDGSVITLAGTNWSSVTLLNSNNVNWADINANATINRGAVNWTSLNKDIQNGGVNWASFHVLAITYGDHSNINWQAIPGS